MPSWGAPRGRPCACPTLALCTPAKGEAWGPRGCRARALGRRRQAEVLGPERPSALTGPSLRSLLLFVDEADAFLRKRATVSVRASGQRAPGEPAPREGGAALLCGALRTEAAPGIS